ncbi:MAG TPA: sulfite exporter TauE/SafE family protein [Ktedonobacteraceae bacterium]
MDYRFSLVGLLIGFLIGLTGMGGGSLLAPIMILVFRVPPVWAVASDITYSSITKALGALVHVRQRQVNFRVALWLACGSVPSTILSIFMVQYVRHHYGNLINDLIIHAIGGVLLLVAVLLFLKPYLMRIIDRRNQEQSKQVALVEDKGESVEKSAIKSWRRPVATALIGAVVGFLVGLTSVGSGTLIIVSIAFLFPRLTPKELVGTDIFQAFLMLLAGSLAYLGTGSINWNIVGLLLIGSLPGVFLGSRLSKYIPNRYMNPVLAVVLAVSGWKLL